MKIIPLSRLRKSKNYDSCYFAIVSDSDYERLDKFNWSVIKGPANTIYAHRRGFTNGKLTTIKMHREILNVNDPKVCIDHKDGNGLNNTRENIRLCTQSQNLKNRRSWGSSGYLGVYKFKRIIKRLLKDGTPREYTSEGWAVNLTVNGKNKHLGSFKEAQQAAAAYNEAAKKYHGEFAKLNIISGDRYLT